MINSSLSWLGEKKTKTRTTWLKATAVSGTKLRKMSLCGQTASINNDAAFLFFFFSIERTVSKTAREALRKTHKKMNHTVLKSKGAGDQRGGGGSQPNRKIAPKFPSHRRFWANAMFFFLLAKTWLVFQPWRACWNVMTRGFLPRSLIIREWIPSIRTDLTYLHMISFFRGDSNNSNHPSERIVARGQ